MSAAQEYLDLVRQQGAPPYHGFNPIAPRSHRWMMDYRELEETRVVGWALWRTIDRDPDGQTGPHKKKRTWFGHDERAGKKGHLEVKHLAEDLNITVANATDALKRTIAKGLIGIDDEGRIYPRGDAAEPRRIKTEDDGEGDDTKEPIFFCTENCPESIRLSFQSLDQKRRAQYVSRYRAMPKPYAKHLEGFDPEARAVRTWRYLQAAEYDDQLEADAMAAARANGVTGKVMAESGYQETRGRDPVSRELTVKLEIRIQPEEFFVQKNGAGQQSNSVQSENSNSYKGENASAQKSASLSGFHSSHSSHSEVNPPSVEKPAEEQEKVAPAARPSGPDETLPDEVTEQNVIRRALETRFGHPLRAEDTLPRDFLKLARQSGLNAKLMAQFIHDKMDRKGALGYPVSGPGALLDWAAKDLPKWIKLNRALIENALRAEEREATARVHRQARAAAAGEAQPFQPSNYNAELSELEEELKRKTRM